MKIAFYGSSLLSSYWNGAATYYRGLLGALAERGWDILFLEPDAFDRQQHRDIDPPDWAEVVVWDNTVEGCKTAMARAVEADVVVKASGVGVFDDVLLGVFDLARPDALTVDWDVDAPATLAEVKAAPDHPLRRVLPQIDHVLTYGGGAPEVRAAASGSRGLVRPGRARPARVQALCRVAGPGARRRHGQSRHRWSRGHGDLRTVCECGEPAGVRVGPAGLRWQTPITSCC